VKFLNSNTDGSVGNISYFINIWTWKTSTF